MMHSAGSKKHADKLNIITFGVGHGDCFLIEFYRHGVVTFRLLYDAGASLPAALCDHLNKTKRADGKQDLDIVVLSHVDGDHRGGLHELLAINEITIGELWLPCLPAYKRLSWLFPARIQTAITEAEKLQAAALTRSIPVYYPLEDHVFRPYGHGALSVTVISPARNLMKKLYSATADNLLPLLVHDPLPLEWLIRGEAIDEEENEFAAGALFNNRYALTPAEFTLPAIPVRTSPAFDNGVKSYKAKLDQPEFFGNPVLNDTSLVLVIDAVLDDNHRRRVVLTGDQENWSWISSQHPMGLGADVMKAPHHGGHVYLADKKNTVSDIEQFWLWTRPRVALVSANGRHGLPHLRFREAVRAAGSTLLCPNKRTTEWIFSDNEAARPKSCCEYFNCDKNQHATIHLSLTGKTEFSSAAACLSGSGHRGAAPVVVLQQRLIEPDESFVRWTQAEVRRQAEWLRNNARKERLDQLSAFQGVHQVIYPYLPATIEKLLNAPGGSERSVLRYDPAPVLRYAAVHDLLWINKQRYYDENTQFVSPLTDHEYNYLLRKIKTFDHLLFIMPRLNERSFVLNNSFTLLSSAERQGFITLCAGWAGVPVEFFTAHIESRLLHDLIANYSARAISSSGYGDTLYYGGNVLLHLYAHDATLPDFLAGHWHDKRSKGPDYYLSRENVDLLINNNDESVLPPLSCSRGYESFNYTVNCKDLGRFIRLEKNDAGEETEIFSADDSRHCWRPLW